MKEIKLHIIGIGWDGEPVYTNKGTIHRNLEHFQKSEYRCRENALAITALEEALLWLRKRTMGREKRGVEGTHKK